VAAHLFKWCQFQHDVLGKDYELTFFKDRNNREIDFIIHLNGQPLYILEVKQSDTSISSALNYLKTKFPQSDVILLCQNPKRIYQNELGVRVEKILYF